ncbi:MAG: FtsQ-type POTRA domain-containing protein [Clostridium sp.]
MSIAKKKIKANKRKVLVNLSLLFIILGVVAGVSLKSSYFLIKNIEVKNNNVISKEEIQVLSKLKDKNIFLLNKESTISDIKTNPYIGNAQISRKLPSTIVIDVSEKKIGAAIKLQEGYVNIDENGKMVQIVSKFPEGKLPILINVPVTGYVANGSVFKKEEQVNALRECVKVLSKGEINSMFSSLDVSDPFNVIFISPKGNIVNIGSVNNIEYKIGYAISILNSDEVKNQTGEIKILDNGRATFKKN